MFYALKASGIPFKFVTACYKPQILSDSEVIFISKEKISNLTFWIKLFFFSFTIRKKKVIFHFHHPYVIIPFLLFSKNKLTILTLHGNQLDSFKRNYSFIKYQIYRIVYFFALKRYSLLISDNEFITASAFKIINFKKQNIITLPVPVDLNLFYPLDKNEFKVKLGFSQEQKIILFAGRFVRQKNPLLAIEVFRRVKAEFPNCLLLMLGAGDQENEMRNLITSYFIDNVFIKHDVAQNEMVYYYNAADVLIVTSFNEGGPLVVKEALACNLPVISTDVGDVKSVIEGMPYCYISSGEPEDFAEKIIYLLEEFHPTDYHSTMIKYSADIFYEKITEIYNGLIRKYSNDKNKQ
ncbi:MAG: glycosyltransferase family 4 protein [Flavobacterium piscis]|nr:glycosyltransferase family 4 protein [Flavobacterium piscis]